MVNKSRMIEQLILERDYCEAQAVGACKRVAVLAAENERLRELVTHLREQLDNCNDFDLDAKTPVTSCHRKPR